MARASPQSSVILLLAMVILAPASGLSGQERVLEAGRVKASLSPRPPGVRIWFDGVAISTASDVVVTTPPWAPHFYVGPDATAVGGATVETFEGGQRLRMIHRGQNDSFTGTETLEIRADGRVESTFEGGLAAGAGQALIQYQMAALNPAVIVGRPYRAMLIDGTQRLGTVPVSAVSSDAEASTLARGFKWIEFDSRVGPLRIEVETDRPLTLYDHRKSRWANEKHPLFWFGDLGSRIRGGESVRNRITYRFEAGSGGSTQSAARALDAEVRQRPTAQEHPWEADPLLIPRPKNAAFTNEPSGEPGFTLWGLPAIPTALSEPAVQRLAANELNRFVRKQVGVELKIRSNMHLGQSGIVFLSLPEPANHPGEYQLDVGRDFIGIKASDPHGFLSAVQTLKQLFTMAPTGHMRFRAATIRDWPSLPFRGIHLFTGGKGNALHKRLIRDLIAALKMNALVLEAEYITWDSHPEIRHPERGMPKGEVRELVELCRELNIEVIPLINTLGHAQWMFHGDVNLDLAEDPEAQWAYCVTNPKTYDFVFDIFREALELFEPQTLHIGHDEFTHRGRYPFREESKKYTAENLLMQDTLKLHAWLKERGVRTMLWGDMFLGKGEGTDALHAASAESAAGLRGQLPKDVIVADWHYVASPPADYVSLDKFREAGLETVAATWNRPDNAFNFARAAFEKKARGLLQTTWAGYSLDPESFEKQIDQYVAYVLAAEAAWNADRPPPERHRLAWKFFDLMGLSTLKPDRQTGWTLDLKSARNYPLRAEGADGWFGLGPEFDLSTVPTGLVRLHGVEFDLAPSGETASAIALRSKLARDPAMPQSVELRFEAMAEQLVFLHTTPFGCPAGETLGRYEIGYPDGGTVGADVVYGRNVLACDDLTAAAEAPAVWWGTNRAGQTVALRALVWTNPSPEKAIRSITLRSSDGSAPVVVLAVTGLTERAR